VEIVDGAAGISKIGHQMLAMSQLFSASFSTLKRVVKGICSCRPLRERRHTKPAKVKCKCSRVLIDQPHLKHYTMHALQVINYITLYCSERTERSKVTGTIGPYLHTPS
jgi:hypothetical protein